MRGEILDIETAQEIAKDKKNIERLKRDKNFFEIEKKRLEKQLDKLTQRNNYLEKINKIFELTETYLPHRIKQISNKKDNKYDYAVLELKKLSDALNYERKKIESREIENEEE